MMLDKTASGDTTRQDQSKLRIGADKYKRGFRGLTCN